MAREAGPEDLLTAHGILLGTSENFGYMSGALKDFFDRTFYQVEGKIASLPCGIFVGAGSDGTGALTSIRRIIKGYPFIEVQEPVIVRGELQQAQIEQCEQLGAALAVGIDMGIY